MLEQIWKGMYCFVGFLLLILRENIASCLGRCHSSQNVIDKIKYKALKYSINPWDTDVFLNAR